MSQENHHSAASRSLALYAGLAIVSLLAPSILRSEDVLVRHRQGALRGFLVLRTSDGALIADGEASQVVSGSRVTAKTLFHFKDGSTYEETAIYSQSKTFRLQHYHLIERGPSFPNPVEVLIDCLRGQVEVRSQDDKGHDKVIKQHMDLPTDLGNGILFTLFENMQPGTSKPAVSLLVTTPKPRIVRVNITPTGTKDPFWIGNSKYDAVHYVLKIDIGGIVGKVAPLVGKQPPDSEVWILDVAPPLVVKFEGQLFEGGPVWQMELAAPTWTPSAASGHQ
ncbi:MAG: hypothetical protein WCB11_03705 [Terriglobales bacterium]